MALCIPARIPPFRNGYRTIPHSAHAGGSTPTVGRWIKSNLCLTSPCPPDEQVALTILLPDDQERPVPTGTKPAALQAILAKLEQSEEQRIKTPVPKARPFEASLYLCRKSGGAGPLTGHPIGAG